MLFREGRIDTSLHWSDSPTGLMDTKIEEKSPTKQNQKTNTNHPTLEKKSFLSLVPFYLEE